MDIDLDTPMTFDPASLFPQWPKASMVQNGKLMKHPCGVHPQNIPIDPVTKLAAIPYAEAEEQGFFKIDFLHLHVYDYFSSKEEINALLEIDPEWELLRSPSVVSQLFQLSKHFKTIQEMNPCTIEELADTLAIIRPGKSYLIPRYKTGKDFVRTKLYEKGDVEASAYGFKKSHAIAYALVVVLQLHLISAGIKFE